MVGPAHYLTLSAGMFTIGLYGVLTRRNILLILLSIELLLNAANLSFVAFSASLGALEGQVVVFFTMIVAAAEVTVGLALVILVFRKTKSSGTDVLNRLKW